MIALNTNNCYGGHCGKGSTQYEWLVEDLRDYPSTCTLAFWHEPIYSSGSNQRNFHTLDDIWKALYESGVDVSLSAHEHNYERFALLDAGGQIDQEKGIRSFVVGTGGGEHNQFVTKILPGSEAHIDNAWGVLKLTLFPEEYYWEFIPTTDSVRDSGHGTCH